MILDFGLNMEIKSERPEDYQAVEGLVKKAFVCAGHSDGNEHNLVARLRETVGFVSELSLVAFDGGELIGHVMLTEIKLNDLRVLALAPLAVLPLYQGKGIGSALLEAALTKAAAMGYDAAVVLGEPEYYARFGFVKAIDLGIYSPQFEGIEEYLQVVELSPGALIDAAGEVVYPDEFLRNNNR